MNTATGHCQHGHSFHPGATVVTYCGNCCPYWQWTQPLGTVGMATASIQGPLLSHTVGTAALTDNEHSHWELWAWPQLPSRGHCCHILWELLPLLTMNTATGNCGHGHSFHPGATVVTYCGNCCPYWQWTQPLGTVGMATASIQGPLLSHTVGTAALTDNEHSHWALWAWPQLPSRGHCCHILWELLPLLTMNTATGHCGHGHSFHPGATVVTYCGNCCPY